jgi:hypothetical protein
MVGVSVACHHWGLHSSGMLCGITPEKSEDLNYGMMEAWNLACLGTLALHTDKLVVSSLANFQYRKPFNIHNYYVYV